MGKGCWVPLLVLFWALLGGCAASSPQALRPYSVLSEVRIDVWGGDTHHVGVVLVDRTGRRCGWEAGAVLQDLFWDCTYDNAEPGIPDEFPPMDDTIGTLRSLAWDDSATTGESGLMASEQPPISSSFVIAAHENGTGLLTAGKCELWVVPIQTGPVTFQIRAKRGSPQHCGSAEFVDSLQSGFRYRYCAAWKSTADSCSVRISLAAREKVGENSKK